MSTTIAAQIAPQSNKTQKPKYDRFLIRRCVRRDQKLQDGIVAFVTKSFTQNDDTSWHPHVDTRTGEVWCDCPDFRFRRNAEAKSNNEIPNVLQVEYQCKHLERAVENCVRHGEIALAQSAARETHHTLPAPRRQMTIAERAEALRLANEF